MAARGTICRRCRQCSPCDNRGMEERCCGDGLVVLDVHGPRVPGARLWPYRGVVEGAKKSARKVTGFDASGIYAGQVSDGPPHAALEPPIANSASVISPPVACTMREAIASDGLLWPFARFEAYPREIPTRLANSLSEIRWRAQYRAIGSMSPASIRKTDTPSSRKCPRAEHSPTPPSRRILLVRAQH